jgi:hypothetical protein
MMIDTPDNGYMVYPVGMWFEREADAKAAAELDSLTAPDYWARVENCDTEEVVARYKRGVEMP